MIVYDLLGAQNRDHGERGIARYVLSLAIALEKERPGWVSTYLVHPHLPVPGSLQPIIDTGRVTLASTFVPPSDGGFFLAGSLMELQEPDQVVVPLWARRGEWRVGSILYDLIPFLYPDRYLTNTTIKLKLKARAQHLASCDRLFSISEASTSDAVKLLGVPAGSITMIGAGASDDFCRPESSRDDVAAQLVASGSIDGLNSQFVLFPTGIEPRKNNDRLLSAYAALPASIREGNQLVLVCRTTDEDRASLDSQAKDLGIDGQLLVTGFVSDEDLISLYQSARLVVFPSEYEGFGLPVLEARRCGAAVVCSDTSSLREVHPDSSSRFDPLSVDSISECLRRALSSDEEIQRLQDLPVPDFTWANSARTTINSIESHLGRWKVRESPRIALMTPLPPESSGIADYSASLIRELSKDCQVTAYTDADPTKTEPIPGVDVRQTHELLIDEKQEGSYHEVIYELGNSEFHIGALKLLRERPGIVEFHDVRLSGLYNQLYERRPEFLLGASVGITLKHWYPHRYRTSLEESVVVWPEQAERFGVLLCREAAHYATQVWTHSEYAATLVELDTGDRPDWVFPLAVSPPSVGSAPTKPTISTFGLVAKIKQHDRLLEAFSVVADRVENSGLRIVGSIDQPSRDWLDSVPTSSEARKRTTYTGHLDRPSWDKELGQTAIAVQLRASSNGESSGAIANLLGAGIPVVATGIGSNLELPEAAVRLVRPDVLPDELGLLLSVLLQDKEQLAEMSTAALEFSREYSYRATAQRMLDRLKLA